MNQENNGRKCPDHITQAFAEKLRKDLEACDLATLEQLDIDFPVLFKNQQFREYEKIAIEQGKWINEDVKEEAKENPETLKNMREAKIQLGIRDSEVFAKAA